MTALLERLNASRRFARSVYAPHKLALRQSVPSALRAVGVTAPAPQVKSASLSVAPWARHDIALGARYDIAPGALTEVAARASSVAPVVSRDAGPALRPAPSSAPLEPQGVANAEPRAIVNLESPLFKAVPLETVPLETVSLETVPLETVPLEAVPLETVPLETVPLEAVQAPSLEIAAPIEFAQNEPLLESDDAVVARAPLEQPVAQTDPLHVQPSVPLEPTLNAQRATQSPADAALEPPVDAPIPRASAAPLEPRLAAVREPAAVSDSSTEVEQVETAFAAPVQPRLEPATPDHLEPSLTAPDLEVLAVPPVPAPSVAAPVSPGIAPIVADPPAPSPAPIQSSARGRVIEEFQARPPRNMPPRTPKVQAAEPALEAASDEAPRRSPEEWARLLRQRFAQPGDEAFDDAKAAAPETPQLEVAQLETAQLETAQLKVSRLETAPSNSTAAAAPNLEPTAVAAPSPLEAAPALSDPPAFLSTEELVSASEIRERSRAALQAIPEDTTQRTPRDWGMALIRRYASSDEATAIGIEAYRDPNDPNPVAAPAPSQSTPPAAPRVSSSRAAASTQSSSATSAIPTVSSRAISSGAASSSTSASAQLESAPSPARRFVAPRSPVSSTVARVTAAAPVQMQLNPTTPRSSEQNDGLETAAQIPARLEPTRANSTAIESQPDQPDQALAIPLEIEGFAALELGDSQTARAVTIQRPGSDSPPSVPARDSTQPDALTPPPLEPVSVEPVHLSGATRRFLEPLVGFDPNEVSVYTGDAARRVTRDLRADAAAQDGAVLLPDASNLETPAQLGLLAHELIHAAGQQSSSPNAPLETPLSVPENAALENAAPQNTALEPPSSAPESPRSLESAPRRFVPALGSPDLPSADQRSADQRSAVPVSSTAPPSNPVSNAVRQSSAPLLTGISSFASEEDRALAAEARVVQIARTESLSADPLGANSLVADPKMPAALLSWNGLPAPWESLPSFDAPASDDSSTEPGVVSLIGSPQGWGSSATTTNPVGYGGSVTTSSTGFSSSASSNVSGNAASSAAQAAEIGRELPAEGGAAAASPDLEQLAKQVYDVLKRRLQSDRRRGGL